jgi:hypothetical protein
VNPVFEAALELQSFCRANSWRFCFIGGLVVARWGEPRTTAVGDGKAIRTCSAEDLVVLKAFAGRDVDWLDVGGIAARQAGRLDEGLIFRELEPLLELKGMPEASGRLREILQRARH